MGKEAKKEMILALQDKYARQRFRQGKSRILDTVCQATGYDRITFTETTFSRTMTCNMTVKADTKESAIDMVVKIKGSISGTWKKVGNIVTLTPGKKAKPSISVETENCPALIQALLVGPVKKELKEELRDEDELEILSISATQFVTNDGEGVKTTYNRVK